MRVVRKETAAPRAGRSVRRGGETQVPVPYVFITVSSRRPRVTHFSNDRFIARHVAVYKVVSGIFIGDVSP